MVKQNFKKNIFLELGPGHAFVPYSGHFLDTFGCSEWYFPRIFLWLVFLRSSLRRHYYISNLIIFCERFSVHCWFAINLLHFSFTTCWLVDKLISVVIFNLRRACQGDVSLNLVDINLKFKGEGTVQNGEWFKIQFILTQRCQGFGKKIFTYWR